MGLAFYIYTILILLVSAGSGMISLSAYFVSRRNSFLLAMFFFLFYFLDVALIFQFEYIGQNREFLREDFYAIDYAFVKIIIALGALESIWLIICDYLDIESVVAKVMPALAFVLSCIVVLSVLPEGKWQQWTFYTLRQAFLLGCLIYAALKYFRSDDELYRTRLRRHRTFFLIVLGFIFFITLEDVLMILVWEPSLESSLLLLYLSQRNFSENFLMLLFAFITLRNAASMLKLRFHEPPDPKDSPSIQGHIDDLLPAFCARHQLTGREREILTLVLAGKDTQNIASELHLATGTVKAHVHNILHKTGHETRRELVKAFWRK